MGFNCAITHRTGYVIFKDFKCADSGKTGIEVTRMEDVVGGYGKVLGGIVVGNTGLNDDDGELSSWSTKGFWGA
jgi:hypothetical protein